MRKTVFIFCFLFSFYSFSQTSFSKEFSLISDNDLYTSTYRDRYYSNGLFLAFRKLSANNKKNSVKKIVTYKIGHMIFTPKKPTLEVASLHDRPFAAYLFASVGNSYYYNSNNALRAEIQVGVIGPNAKGQELQNFMHTIYNYPQINGWIHQIQNAFALNFNVGYLKYFPKVSSDYIDFSNYNQLKIGTVFTGVTTGLYTRIGFKKLQPLNNSVAFNANLNTNNNTSSKESFIFLKPLLNYTAYDATIEGSFLNTNSPVTFDVMPFYFSLDVGYSYYYKRFSFGYTLTYHTKKLKSDEATSTNTYGSISLGYFFN